MNAVLPVGADHNRTGAGFTDAFTGTDWTGIIKVNRIMPIRNGEMAGKFFIAVSFVRSRPGNNSSSWQRLSIRRYKQFNGKYNKTPDFSCLIHIP
jgi:hypothetical protein